MSNRPNIIYILSDQHNAAVMGCAGDPYVRTPNLDALQKRSVSLENCYCASPLCVPSRSAILSGLLPCHNGVFNNMQCLRSDYATFVNSLAVGGYETVLCGRMHFVGFDQRHGYEKRLVGDITPCYIGRDNEAEIYGSFRRSSGQNLTSIKKSGAGHSAVLDFDHAVTTAACEFLKERINDRPLFLTVGFYGPHCPYIAPKELYDYYYYLLPELPDMTEEKQIIHPAIRQWYDNRRMEEVTSEDVRRIRAAYYAMVEYIDIQVGRVLATVEQCLDLENTIIIYGSDHGDNIGEHGLFWKTNFYEGAARVPMMFSWKEHFVDGARISSLTSLLDVAPTLLHLSNTPDLPEYDGIDLGEVLRTGRDLPEGRAVISLCGDIKGDAPSAMVRQGRYKLIWHAGYNQRQLFDLEHDPHELSDQGGQPEYQGVIRSLEQELKGLWEPQRALRDLELAKKHFDLMTQWHKVAKMPIIEEWHGDPAANWLEADCGTTSVS